MTNGSELHAHNIARGVTLILAAAFTISVQDVVFKLFSSELTLWQIFALRGVFAIPMILAITLVRGESAEVVKVALSKWPLLRSISITITFLAFYSAIPFLSLSTVGAANYIAPIFVTLLAAYVIKEPVGPFGWLAVVLGFIGVVVLLQPGTDAFSLWVALPVIGAGFYAVAHIITRTRCQSLPLLAMALSVNLIMMLAGLAVSSLLFLLKPQGEIAVAYPYLFGLWTGVDTNDWLILAVLAGFTIVISLLLAAAYQSAPPSTVSTFEYSYLVFVALWDILFFNTVPTMLSITGILMIVTAGLMVVRRSA